MNFGLAVNVSVEIRSKTYLIFEYSVKIDFEIFKNAEEQEAKKVLAREILRSLVVFDTMRSKIKNFDFVSFKTDLVDYFERNQLI